jgi:hypothetical protein
MSTEEFLKDIDWELLDEQKERLLDLSYNHMLKEYWDSLDGVIHLIDYMQDHAVDVLHIPENIVFNQTNDEDGE